MSISKSVSKKLLVLLGVLVGAGALWFIFSKVPIFEVIKMFKTVTLLQIIYYIIIQIMIFFTLAYRWKIVLKSQGIIDISLSALNNYKIVGYAVSFLTPTAKVGGEPVRAGLLSSRHNIPFQKALASVVIDKTLELTSSALFFVLGGLVVLMSFVVDPQLRFWIIGVSIFFILLAGLFNYRMIAGKSFFHKTFQIFGFDKVKKLKKFAKKLKEFERFVIKFYHEDRKFFVQAIIVSLISWILMFFEYSIAGAFLGQNFSPLQIFLIFSFVGAAYLIPIPMALGALEAGQISVFKIIKVDAAAGVALSLIVRVKDMIISAIGIIMLGVYGLKLKEVMKNAKSIDFEVKRLKDIEDTKSSKDKS